MLIIFSKEKFFEGINLIIWGLFKKVVIADSLAPLVDKIFLNPSLYDGGTLLLGIFYFTFQIYCDFSGYSDIAIGTAKCLGLDFVTNFNYPYFAKNIGEFWRRWHISLGTFFLVFLYIPLGGNRQKQIRNLLVVWSLTGLWHGASWNYVLWGLYFFVLLFLEKNLLLKIYGKIIKPFRVLITLILVVYGWSFFYFEDMNTFLDFNLSLFSGDISVSPILKQDIYQNVFWLLLVLFQNFVKISFLD